ncbi:MAG: exodeoxyribonuclease VII large subunit [Pseudomonadota bacterium]|nr:exodeoxyribonuclease VII large subunit [Pseudomonadota bacterium]
MSEVVPNVAEFTVTELSFALKRTIEDAYGYVRVRGEISGYRGPHGSGHCYFCLKDDRSRIDAVIWKHAVPRLRAKLQEGLEVVATGKITTYPGKSTYQIQIESVEPAGIGALMALLEERKRRLAAEGLFDESRKRPLPFLPDVIGVVTSPTGAVIRDILHRLDDRFPSRVLVWPVRVQGETAAEEVAAAVRGFNALPEDGPIPRPDVLIVARGGGSLEDLWAFNEEVVVRATAESRIPVISAVGHETDWTLIDFAADWRAPTPTAAAERVVPVRADLAVTLTILTGRQANAVLRHFEACRGAIRSAGRGLGRLEDLLALPRQRLDETATRLSRALKVFERERRLALENIRARLSVRLLDRTVRLQGESIRALEGRRLRAFLALVRARRRQFGTAEARLRPETLERHGADMGRRLNLLYARAGRALAYTAVRRKDQLLGLVGRFERQGGQVVAERRGRLASLSQLLRALSYQGVLARGFALVRDREGRMLRSAGEIAPGMPLDIAFADGHAEALATGGAKRAVSRRRERATAQGSLFDS